MSSVAEGMFYDLSRLGGQADLSISLLAPSMKQLYLIAVALVIGTAATFGQVQKGASAEELQKGGGKVVKVLDHRMTPAELEVFLKKRTSGQFFGSFDSYTSLLWAMNEVGVWSKGTDAGGVQLQCPFPKTYRPTWKELMDVLARQVDCTWRYDHDTGYWVFETNRMETPFSVTLAKGWSRRDEGQTVVLVPPIAPVGMDVYVLGHFSSEDPKKLPEIFDNARKYSSMRFAQPFKSGVTEKDFRSEKVCGETASYFSAPTPRDPKLHWRQWAFVKNGWSFMVVSVISEENEPQLLPEVKAMIASLQVKDKS